MMCHMIDMSHDTERRNYFLIHTRIFVLYFAANVVYTGHETRETTPATGRKTTETNVLSL